MIKTAIVLIALLDAGAPPDIAAGAMLGAAMYAIPVEVMAGYLVSGHPGARYSGECGDPKTIEGGTCGPYRLSMARIRDYGAPDGHRDALRNHRVLSALPAGHMLSRARRVHHEGEGRRRACDDGHDWRAHPKSSTRARASPKARWKVRRQREAEWAMCGGWCRAARWLH
jgi:hypothetical protein